MGQKSLSKGYFLKISTKIYLLSLKSLKILFPKQLKYHFNAYYIQLYIITLR